MTNRSTPSAQDNLQNAEHLASGFPGLLVEAQKIASSFRRGGHGRKRPGAGEAFWQFRDYQSGDARRDIDWRQSAKRDAVYVRQREWEIVQGVWLYRDASASMSFRSFEKYLYKKDYAEVLLLALAMVLLDGGEQVGLIGADMAPQSHAGAIERVYECLAQQNNLTEMPRTIPSHAYAVLMSDFYYPPDDLRVFCEKLAYRGIKGQMVQVYDEAEQALPYSGRVKFEDIENPTGTPLVIAQVESVRAQYAEKYQAHRAELAEIARGIGWGFKAVATAEAPEQVLSAIYDDLSQGAG